MLVPGIRIGFSAGSFVNGSGDESVWTGPVVYAQPPKQTSSH